MKSFNDDRLSAPGQIDQYYPSSTNCRVRLVLPIGQDHIANGALVFVVTLRLDDDFPLEDKR